MDGFKNYFQALPGAHGRVWIFALVNSGLFRALLGSFPGTSGCSSLHMDIHLDVFYALQGSFRAPMGVSDVIFLYGHTDTTTYFDEKL